MMPRVDPELHEFEVLERLIAEGRYSAEEILESLAALAELQRWDDLWSIADRIGREVSVLFDSEMRIWVDVGTAGRVELEAPIGSTIPFRMWIHTHPKNAYWSETDLATLSSHGSILKQAIVLGFDHMKITNRVSYPQVDCLGSGSLSMWTDEPIIRFSEVDYVQF